MRPNRAISLKTFLDSPNIRICPLGRPVKLQRLRARTGDEFLGSNCNSSHLPSFFNCSLLAAYFFMSRSRFLSLALIDSFAISYFLLNGKPNSLSNSKASLSVLADVTNVISIPLNLLILSTSISGNIICSGTPRV